MRTHVLSLSRTTDGHAFTARERGRLAWRCFIGAARTAGGGRRGLPVMEADAGGWRSAISAVGGGTGGRMLDLGFVCGEAGEGGVDGMFCGGAAGDCGGAVTAWGVCGR